MAKIYFPQPDEGFDNQVPEVPYDGLDWDHQFEAYYQSRVHNAKIKAKKLLESKVDDDRITSYYPYFGIAIHHGSIDFR